MSDSVNFLSPTEKEQAMKITRKTKVLFLLFGIVGTAIAVYM